MLSCSCNVDTNTTIHTDLNHAMPCCQHRYKPDLNITEWKGSKSNNLLENSGMTTGVYLDEETTDPSQRYKISTGTNGAGGIATSADGLTWTNNKDLSKMTHAR